MNQMSSESGTQNSLFSTSDISSTFDIMKTSPFCSRIQKPYQSKSFKCFDSNYL